MSRRIVYQYWDDGTQCTDIVHFAVLCQIRRENIVLLVT